MKHAHLAFASSRPAAQALAAAIAMTVATASLGAPDRHLEHADRHHRGGAGEAERDAADGRVGLDGPDPHARRGRVGRRRQEHRLQVVAVQRALLQPRHQLQAAARRQQQPVRAGQLQRTPRTRATAPTTRFPTARLATCGRSSSPTRTRRSTSRPAFPTCPGPGYYYVYTGPETLGYASAPCKQFDTRAASIPTPGGGLWTRYDVSTQPIAQQTNFAIWYSFYRTRLALTKSAASFAFAPINDTRRVGFITVEPKDLPTSAAINPIRYLPLGDFNAVQKGKWFSKVFSQEAKGASPAREGLARVGRYYGGQDDGINSRHGGDGRGRSDPVRVPAELHHHDHRWLLERPYRDARRRRR